MKKFVVGRPLLIWIPLTFVLLICVEVILRKTLGLGETVLFQRDDTFEYIAQANQDRTRFGNRILYNEYSMRSYPLRSDDQCIILGFGDSVINGGALTDHDSLATTMAEDQLNKGGRFLNISAGSWGPDNCAGYVRKFGDFKARMIFLVVSSHDAYDNMTFEATAGYHESYPDRQPASAIAELFSRYLTMFLEPTNDEVKQDLATRNRQGIRFNSGFDFFKNYSRDHNIPLIICLHLELPEIENHQFNTEGQEILNYCKINNIKVITGLEIGENESHLRDEIHLNEKGQKLWANAFVNEVEQSLPDCL